MHIVFLTNEYPKKGLNGGGIGSFVQFLGLNLIERNIKISVVGVNNSSKLEIEKDSDITIYRVARSKLKIGKFYENTKRILQQIEDIDKISKIDIVEGSELNFAFFPRKTTYKKVIRLHGGHHFFAKELGNEINYWKAYQEKKSFKNADAYIAVSNYVGEQTQKYLNNNFNFKKIFNSVDTDEFKPLDNAEIVEDSLLFVGTVCEKKGIRQLVQAMPEIKKSIPNIKLKIVGRDWFFPNGDSYVEYLKTFIENSVKDTIEIVGAVPHTEIPRLLSEANICVYPSHMEAMPIAWLEALAQGKVVVAGDIGPGREAVINNKTGILVNPHNPKEIAETIIKVLSNKELMSQLMKASRLDILDRFGVRAIVDENIKFYQKIINH